MSSYSADRISRSYMDEASKAALLGSNPATSFGLPMSTGTKFKLSDLEAGPVVIVPAVAGAAIVPFRIMCGLGVNLPADISGNFGWLAPDPDDPGEHDEPWLAGTAPLWFAGEDQGSVVILPNNAIDATARLWPECVLGRALALKVDAPPAARGARKGRGKKAEDEKDANGDDSPRAEAQAEDEEMPDPELIVVTFYTVF